MVLSKKSVKKPGRKHDQPSFSRSLSLCVCETPCLSPQLCLPGFFESMRWCLCTLSYMLCLASSLLPCVNCAYSSHRYIYTCLSASMMSAVLLRWCVCLLPPVVHLLGWQSASMLLQTGTSPCSSPLPHSCIYTFTFTVICFTVEWLVNVNISV